MSSDNTDLNDALKEILPFLDVLTPTDYKKQILEHILGMTGTKDGVQVLCKNEKLLDNMIDLICNDKDDTIRHECIKFLVNLTSSSMTSSVLLSKIMVEYFIEFMLKLLILKDNESADSVSMLLTNMSQNENHAKTVAKYFTEPKDDIHLDKFITAFCDQACNKHCELHYLGSFLANLTVVKEFRLLLLENDMEFFRKIFPFTQYKKSLVRRQAVCRMIKNCLFEMEYHEKMLSDDCELVTYLLLPLAGPEELDAEENDKLPLDLQYLPPDKEREKNTEVRILLIQSLFQLCSTKSCRLKMKNNGSYYILREFHSSIAEEKNERLEYDLENLIQVLIGDEPEEGMENLREVVIPEDVQKKFDQSSS